MHPDELYALPPEEFTAARDEAAKEAKKAGDAERAKELKALRKPSVSAWLLNLLAARETELLEQLLALGPALAEAQAAGQGDELRELGAQRRALVEAVTASAVSLVDRDVTATVRQEVSTTLDAALADAQAAGAVRSGRLVRPLSYAGFGGVDLDGAVAVPCPEPAHKRAKKPAKDKGVAAAEAEALEAAGRLDDAVRACERLEQERADAEQQAAQAEQAVRDAKRALTDAERREKSARETRAAAEQAAAAATQAVQEAQDAAEQARAALDRLRRRR